MYEQTPTCACHIYIAVPTDAYWLNLWGKHMTAGRINQVDLPKTRPAWHIVAHYRPMCSVLLSMPLQICGPHVSRGPREPAKTRAPVPRRVGQISRNRILTHFLHRNRTKPTTAQDVLNDSFICFWRILVEIPTAINSNIAMLKVTLLYGIKLTQTGAHTRVPYGHAGPPDPRGTRVPQDGAGARKTPN